MMFRMLMAVAHLPSLLWRDGFKDAYFATAFLVQLREAERFARKALLRDALVIAATLAPAKCAERKRAARTAAPQAFTMDHARWRVGFRVAPRARMRATVRKNPLRRLLGPTLAQARNEARFELMLQPADAIIAEAPARLAPHTLRGCALRYEALRRVVENPAPYARRLARRLVRQGGEAIAAAIARIFVPDYAASPLAPPAPLTSDTS